MSVLRHQFASSAAGKRPVAGVTNSGRRLYRKKTFTVNRYIQRVVGHTGDAAAMMGRNRVNPGSGSHISDFRLVGSVIDPPDLPAGIILHDGKVFFESGCVRIGQVVCRYIRPQRFDEHA